MTPLGIRSDARDGHDTNWLLYPEIPTADEIMATRPPLLPKRNAGSAFDSKSEYLEMQYRLHRYEATELLRRAVLSTRQGTKIEGGREFRIYEKVRIEGYTMTILGAFCRLSFEPLKSKESCVQETEDEGTEVLTPGTLVVLSPSEDHFKHRCLMATVAQYSKRKLGTKVEDHQTRHRTHIMWANKEDASLDPGVSYVMIEGLGGYFEALRYVMLGLQEAAFEQSQLENYILNTPSETKVAEYLRNFPERAAQTSKSLSAFDYSQQQAFAHMTSKEIALVQGPPGTGKTFTSVAAIQAYVDLMRHAEATDTTSQSSTIPVIVAAQTNHSLDQIVELCKEHGVGNFVRLGGQSASNQVNERSMTNLRRRSKAKRVDSQANTAKQAAQVRLHRALNRCLPKGSMKMDELITSGLLTTRQAESLTELEWELDDCDESCESAFAAWLDEGSCQRPSFVYTGSKGVELTQYCSDNASNEVEDIESTWKDGFVPIPNPAGTSTQQLVEKETTILLAEHLLATCSDLYTIQPSDRQLVYQYIHCKMMDRARTDFQNAFDDFNIACDRLKVSRWNNNIDVLSAEKVRIIACTTTGLGKYRRFLASLRPQILIIEEAAESKEASITSALFPSLEQLVLVGDHQQLTPHVDMGELRRYPYHLDLSLLERLIVGGMEHVTLKVQRRMVPELREIVQTSYPWLEDHESVLIACRRPPVPGMACHRKWWFDHRWPDNRDKKTMSCFNVKEATMVAGFANYLVKSGTSREKITILTYYKRQVEIIIERLRWTGDGRLPEQPWSVRTVDDFQGEENDIIILSLVRSAKPTYSGRSVGFAADQHRAVVATSRARRGLYVFGNASNLLSSGGKSYSTWVSIYHAFGHSCGSYIPVTCTRHGRNATLRCANEWFELLGTGCGRSCKSSSIGLHPSIITGGNDLMRSWVCLGYYSSERLGDSADGEEEQLLSVEAMYR